MDKRSKSGEYSPASAKGGFIGEVTVPTGILCGEPGPEIITPIIATPTVDADELDRHGLRIEYGHGENFNRYGYRIVKK